MTGEHSNRLGALHTATYVSRVHWHPVPETFIRGHVTININQVYGEWRVTVNGERRVGTRATALAPVVSFTMQPNPPVAVRGPQDLLHVLEDALGRLLAAPPGE